MNEMYTNMKCIYFSVSFILLLNTFFIEMSNRLLKMVSVPVKL